MSNDIIEGLQANKQQAVNGRYLGISIAIVSILNGIFFIMYSGMLSMFFKPYVENVPEIFVGWMFVFFGCLKLIGILKKSNAIRRIAIVALSFFWGSLFFVAAVYSFGVGFPSLSFIFAGKMAADCMSVSVRGFYKK